MVYWYLSFFVSCQQFLGYSPTPFISNLIPGKTWLSCLWHFVHGNNTGKREEFNKKNKYCATYMIVHTLAFSDKNNGKKYDKILSCGCLVLFWFWLVTITLSLLITENFGFHYISVIAREKQTNKQNTNEDLAYNLICDLLASCLLYHSGKSFTTTLYPTQW